MVIDKSILYGLQIDIFFINNSLTLKQDRRAMRRHWTLVCAIFAAAILSKF